MTEPPPAAEYGLIGLAVMGQNLALNIARHGFSLVVYNRTAARTQEFIANRVTDEPDCLADFERKLNAWGLRSQAESDAMRERQEKELLEATRRVLEEPKPDPAEIWDYVYADRNIVAAD